jgi:hypothetical protein
MNLKSSFMHRLCSWRRKLQGQPKSIEEAVEEVIQQLQANHLSVSWGDRLLTIDKSTGFLNDPQFAKAFGEIRGAHQYDQYGGHHTIAWRLNTLCWAARRGLQLEGDFVECGVFKGDMAWVVLSVLGYDAIPETIISTIVLRGFLTNILPLKITRPTPGFWNLPTNITASRVFTITWLTDLSHSRRSRLSRDFCRNLLNRLARSAFRFCMST